MARYKQAASQTESKTGPQNAAPAPTPHKAKSGLAIAGLVLGIIALLTSFLPIVNNLSAMLAILGVIFAVIGLIGTLRGKKSGKGLAIAATVINVLAFAVVMGTQSMYSAAIDEATNSLSSTAVSAAAETNDSQAAAQGNQQAAASAASEESSDKYAIADEQLVEDEYTSTIKGTFTNKSGKELSYVQVSYSLFDADGAQIGTALANTNNLADGGTWKFEAATFKQPGEVASFKIADVSGF